MITQAELKKWVNYNPENGIFTAIKKSKSRNIGDICGNNTSTGYLRFNICGVLNYSHRFAFLYMTGELPTNEVDHINHIKSDNKWSNLRQVTHKENHKNRPMYKSNKNGCFGIKKPKGETKWIAIMYDSGKEIRISSHKNKIDAINARKKAEIKYGFHKNHGK